MDEAPKKPLGPVLRPNPSCRERGGNLEKRVGGVYFDYSSSNRSSVIRPRRSCGIRAEKNATEKGRRAYAIEIVILESLPSIRATRTKGRVYKNRKGIEL